MEGVKKSQFRADVLSGWPLNECPLLCKGFFGEFPASYTKVFTKILTSKVDFFFDTEKCTKTVLPLLATLASAVLAVPVSACKSERTFSKGGLFVTPQRQRLAADLIECIIIISQNSLLGFDDC